MPEIAEYVSHQPKAVQPIIKLMGIVIPISREPPFPTLFQGTDCTVQNSSSCPYKIHGKEIEEEEEEATQSTKSEVFAQCLQALGFFPMHKCSSLLGCDIYGICSYKHLEDWISKLPGFEKRCWIKFFIVEI